MPELHPATQGFGAAGGARPLATAPLLCGGPVGSDDACDLSMPCVYWVPDGWNPGLSVLLALVSLVLLGCFCLGLSLFLIHPSFLGPGR